jgi:hypothetical protein
MTKEKNNGRIMVMEDGCWERLGEAVNKHIFSAYRLSWTRFERVGKCFEQIARRTLAVVAF